MSIRYNAPINDEHIVHIHISPRSNSDVSFFFFFFIEFPIWVTDRLDFLDYDPIEIPSPVKRMPVNLNNVANLTEAYTRKMRIKHFHFLAPFCPSFPNS